jgi:hypothetical protein
MACMSSRRAIGVFVFLPLPLVLFCFVAFAMYVLPLSLPFVPACAIFRTPPGLFVGLFPVRIV